MFVKMELTKSLTKAIKIPNPPNSESVNLNSLSKQATVNRCQRILMSIMCDIEKSTF